MILESRTTVFDTNTVKLYLELASKLELSNLSKSIDYAEKAVILAQKVNGKRLYALSLASKGNLLYINNQYDKSLESYLQALTLNIARDDKGFIAKNYNNIGLIYVAITDYPKALEYFQYSFKYNELINNTNGMISNLGNIGTIFNSLMDYNKAIEYFDKAMVLCDRTNNISAKSGLLNNLGNAYTSLNQLDKALEYKLQSYAMLNKNNQSRIANSLGNLGNVYLKLNKFDQAIENHRKAMEIHQKLKDKRGLVSNYIGLGEIYLKLNSLDSSKLFFAKSIALSEDIKDKKSQAASYEKLSAIYESKGKLDSAYYAYKKYLDVYNSLKSEEKLKEILQMTLKYQFAKKEDSLINEQIIIDTKLKEKTLLAVQQQQKIELQNAKILLAEKQKQIQHLAFLKTQADLKVEQGTRNEKEKQLEIVEKEKQIQSSVLKLQEADIEIKESEIRRQKSMRSFYLIILGLLSVLMFFIFRNFQIQKKNNVIIQKERQKSETLLLNILPTEIAEELKEKGSAKAKYYEDVTVMFTDFVGFTQVAEKLSAQELVDELNECFTAFDEIVLKHGLEKIKTIGDAYMAVSGLPLYNPAHAISAVRACHEIIEYIKERRKHQNLGFEIRVGLHSGPVIAGIVGSKKFAFDIWGDTVNIAARMESSGIPGQINISDRTCEKLGSMFSCTSRGKIVAKNKGELEMFLVDLV